MTRANSLLRAAAVVLVMCIIFANFSTPKIAYASTYIGSDTKTSGTATTLVNSFALVTTRAYASGSLVIIAVTDNRCGTCVQPTISGISGTPVTVRNVLTNVGSNPPSTTIWYVYLTANLASGASVTFSYVPPNGTGVSAYTAAISGYTPTTSSVAPTVQTTTTVSTGATSITCPTNTLATNDILHAQVIGLTASSSTSTTITYSATSTSNYSTGTSISKNPNYENSSSRNITSTGSVIPVATAAISSVMSCTTLYFNETTPTPTPTPTNTPLPTNTPTPTSIPPTNTPTPIPPTATPTNTPITATNTPTPTPIPPTNTPTPTPIPTSTPTPTNTPLPTATPTPNCNPSGNHCCQPPTPTATPLSNDPYYAAANWYDICKAMGMP